MDGRSLGAGRVAAYESVGLHCDGVIIYSEACEVILIRDR